MEWVNWSLSFIYLNMPFSFRLDWLNLGDTETIVSLYQNSKVVGSVRELLYILWLKFKEFIKYGSAMIKDVEVFSKHFAI